MVVAVLGIDLSKSSCIVVGLDAIGRDAVAGGCDARRS